MSNFPKKITKFVKKLSDTELLVREATKNEDWATDTQLLSKIASLTYSNSKCLKIMNQISIRLNESVKYWRRIYKALDLVEYLLRHGNETVIEYIKKHIQEIRTLEKFQYIVKGIDRGENIKNKAILIVELLHNEKKLQRVRKRSRKVQNTLAVSSETFTKRKCKKKSKVKNKNKNEEGEETETGTETKTETKTDTETETESEGDNEIDGDGKQTKDKIEKKLNQEIGKQMENEEEGSFGEKNKPKIVEEKKKQENLINLISFEEKNPIKLETNSSERGNLYKVSQKQQNNWFGLQQDLFTTKQMETKSPNTNLINNENNNNNFQRQTRTQSNENYLSIFDPFGSQFNSKSTQNSFQQNRKNQDTLQHDFLKQDFFQLNKIKVKKKETGNEKYNQIPFRKIHSDPQKKRKKDPLKNKKKKKKINISTNKGRKITIESSNEFSTKFNYSRTRNGNSKNNLYENSFEDFF
ncbi:epsin/ent-related [Anaeramoeba flamelloides]|uniref:Epsin/ent-related n=1 Tax=Anaeramoeba flamelloides TaxID=1746091 RepID=A0ABQ8YHM5_9EUKA|nr:epsin/ent-related [Anaeramoeba flamelloides]